MYGIYLNYLNQPFVPSKPVLRRLHDALHRVSCLTLSVLGETIYFVIHRLFIFFIYSIDNKVYLIHTYFEN